MRWHWENRQRAHCDFLRRMILPLLPTLQMI